MTKGRANRQKTVSEQLGQNSGRFRSGLSKPLGWRGDETDMRTDFGLPNVGVWCHNSKDETEVAVGPN